MPGLGHEEDPLKWWKWHKIKFPLLSKLAQESQAHSLPTYNYSIILISTIHLNFQTETCWGHYKLMRSMPSAPHWSPVSAFNTEKEGELIVKDVPQFLEVCFTAMVDACLLCWSTMQNSEEQQKKKEILAFSSRFLSDFASAGYARSQCDGAGEGPAVKRGGVGALDEFIDRAIFWMQPLISLPMS